MDTRCLEASVARMRMQSLQGGIHGGFWIVNLFLSVSVICRGCRRIRAWWRYASIVCITFS